MNQTQIDALIAEALQLRQEISVRELRLHAIEAQLKDYAKKTLPSEPLADGERQGHRHILHSSLGALPVAQTADSLKKEIPMETPEADALLALCGDNPHFKTLFGEKHAYTRRTSDGKAFRNQAAELLGAEKGAALVALMSSKRSAAVIQWESLKLN